MSEFNPPLTNADGDLRLRRFAVATVSSAILVAAVTGVILKMTAPVDTWTAAVGLGAMIGFWVSPLLGALIGNGYHEIMADRATREVAEPATATDSSRGPIPLPATG